MCGTATVVKEDVTTSGRRFGAVLTHVSKTYHQISRPLATADEIMRLRSPVKDENDLIVEPGDMLVFVAGHAPILGTQSLYFRDPVFLERAQLRVPTTDSLHRSKVSAIPVRNARRRGPILLIALGAAASCSMLLAGGLGFRLNETPSVPVGLWRVSAVAVLERGRRGLFLPAGDGRFLKSAPARLP